MSELVSLTQDGEIAVITVNNPPVNAISPGVPEGIAAAVAAISKDAAIKAAVLIGGGRTFIAGADIKEFGKVTSGEKKRGSLLPLLLAIEDCPKPMIAAIHGNGFRRRAGSGDGPFITAWPRLPPRSVSPKSSSASSLERAGTQRLPRLAGVEKAVEMCAFGEPVKAQAALACGIVDRIIEGDLLTGAVEFAREGRRQR